MGKMQIILNKYPDNRHLNLIIGIDRQYAAKILSRTVFLCKFITGIGKQLPEKYRIRALFRNVGIVLNASNSSLLN